MNKGKNKDTVWYHIVFEYVLLIIISGIVLYLVLGMKEADIAKYPLFYSSGGDGITGLVTAKSMLENGWIYENSYLGAPFDGTNYDATTMELLLSFLEQCLVWLTGNWILAYNLFYLSAYFLIGITAFYSLKKLNINEIIALPSAVIFAFAPYHQMRGAGHLYLGMYFMVPLMVLYMYRLMKGERLFQKGAILFHKEKQGWITTSNLLRVLCLMGMALTGIYYAFFTCFFFCIVILYWLFNSNYGKENGKQSKGENIKGIWKAISQPIISIVIIVGTLVIAAIPNLLYWLQNGRAEAVTAKGGEGAELYGLKIIQLLLPMTNHRIAFFAKVREFYDSNYPLVNENGASSLGVIMAIGFVILCVALFMSFKLPKESNIRIGSLFTLAAVLFGTVGGFAVILSFVTGAIRCYNRFSIFIAMFSLIAIAQLLQNLYLKVRNRGMIGCIMLILLAVGIFDQTTQVPSGTYQAYAQAFEADKEFVQEIEQMEEDGAMIYQMPYMRYPENGGINNMPDYAHMVGYLHSSHLRWSYGSVARREGDCWSQAVNTLPLGEQIQTIREAGFAGIYVDWNAYLPDERAWMESQFAVLIGDVAVSDADNMRVYYSFSH